MPLNSSHGIRKGEQMKYLNFIGSAMNLFFHLTIWGAMIAMVYAEYYLLAIAFACSLIYIELMKISSRTINIDASDIGLNPKMMETLKRVMKDKKEIKEEKHENFFGPKND